MPKRWQWRQNRLIAKLIKALFPSCCVFCGKILPESDKPCICNECKVKTERLRPQILRGGGEFFDGSISTYAYVGLARAGMIKFKFKHGAYMAPVFAQEMAEQVREAEITDFDIMTWVPVHRKTKRKRGYDQAELLARNLGRELDCAVAPLLRKKRYTEPMHTLGPAERRANVLGAFEMLNAAQKLDGVKILLTDDTFTTGATVSECARILKTNGAEKVMCVTFTKAQGHRPKSNGTHTH